MPRRPCTRAPGSCSPATPPCTTWSPPSDGPDDDLADRLAAAAAANLARGDAHAAADLTLKASRVGSAGTASDERLLDAVNLFLIDGDLATAKALATDLEATPPTARRVYLQARLAWFAGEPDAAESLATEAWSQGDQLSPDHLGSLAAILAQLHNMRADGLGAAEWAAKALVAGPPTRPRRLDERGAGLRPGPGGPDRRGAGGARVGPVGPDAGPRVQPPARRPWRTAGRDRRPRRRPRRPRHGLQREQRRGLPATAAGDGRPGRGGLPPRLLGRVARSRRARALAGRGHRAGVGPGVPAQRGRPGLRRPR